ncbi:hypothetical protein J2TS4_08990 [Paenibacillus sp. J2TS4]|nr:MGMT family protein [Paenibacillus sp. J2TS4]GIP31689.1 hypothetical protein J2TS4_08990 [Paenibacillus sp. J2TS4]
MTNQIKGTIYWSLLTFQDWTMHIVAMDEGLCFVGSQNHRVIGKNGALTGYRGGMDMKTKLLQLERNGLRGKGDRQHA